MSFKIVGMYGTYRANDLEDVFAQIIDITGDDLEAATAQSWAFDAEPDDVYADPEGRFTMFAEEENE